jgi:cyclopropane fatty-acyl-phospholipid synthase-like methyltransferase
VDATLVKWTNQVAWKRNWTLRALTNDLTQAPAPAEWGQFDAVISFSVLEHLARPGQATAVERLAGLVKPHGVLALTFDFGKDAPQPNALRTETEVHRLIAASGMKPLHGDFTDSGQRFALDKRHPRSKFTFASLFLKKVGF